MKYKTISILGGGWLGAPLATFLEQKGYEIKISTASKENYEHLTEAHKNVFQLSVRSSKVEGEQVEAFLESDILIINITPNRDELEQEQLANLLPLIEASKIQKVLFVSSTSVYPNVNRKVSEAEGIEKKTHHLYRSEQFLKSSTHFDTTIVRMAGLVGGKRHPGRFFRKTGRIKNANAPINLIHRVDCLAIIHQIILQNAWGKTFNACSDTHPLKKIFYPVAAKSLGLEPPSVEEGKAEDFKIVDNQKVKEYLGLTLQYPDLLILLQEEDWK